MLGLFLLGRLLFFKIIIINYYLFKRLLFHFFFFLYLSNKFYSLVFIFVFSPKQYFFFFFFFFFFFRSFPKKPLNKQKAFSISTLILIGFVLTLMSIPKTLLKGFLSLSSLFLLIIILLLLLLLSLFFTSLESYSLFIFLSSFLFSHCISLPLSPPIFFFFIFFFLMEIFFLIIDSRAPLSQDSEQILERGMPIYMDLV